MDVNDRIEAVKAEYARWIRIIGSDDPYIGKVTIGIKEVMQAHFLLAEYFAQIGEGVGGVGPKDLHLLHGCGHSHGDVELLTGGINGDDTCKGPISTLSEILTMHLHPVAPVRTFSNHFMSADRRRKAGKRGRFREQSGLGAEGP